MLESTITVKGQTSLPRDVRAALGLTGGDRVRYMIPDGEVRILKTRSVKELRGALARPDQRPVSLDKMDEAIGAVATESSMPEK